MPQRYLLFVIVVLCATLLLFIWMERGSLCELHIKQGTTELAAVMAYEARR